MSQSFHFDPVDFATFGAIGEPGRRLFVLQVVAGDQTITLKLEKQQVAATSEYLGELLDDAPRPGHVPEDLELRAVAEIAWVVGRLAAAYDTASDRVLLVIDELVTDDTAEDETQAARAHVALTREQAAALAIRGTALVGAGRPPCPLCGHPLDPSGHACPRTNGNRPPQA